MASLWHLKNLVDDSGSYQKAFSHYLERSTGHQCMQDFMDNLLPDILARTLNEKSHVNIIGVGSGSGGLDLKMFNMLHLKYPHMTVDNEVVEPNPQQLRLYRDLVSQTEGLDYLTFNWNEMTSQEFEEQWNEKKTTKRADIIHMFQALYYVKDRGATISFFQSLLNKNGKLLITLMSGECGLSKMREAYRNKIHTGIDVSTEDIKKDLESKGMSYQSYILPCTLDITECFTEGDEKGELMLDILTHVQHFSESASPELKAWVMTLLRCFSVESNGKVIMTNNYELIVLDQLP